MSYYGSVGVRLKENLMAGLPTRTKSEDDYTGIPIPPCGDFAKTNSSSRPPWLQSRAPLNSSATLHQEIVDFVQYMAPTPQEIATRKDLVHRFTSLITSFKTNATVRPVGSYVTGLYLPTSDIDMVLTVDHAYTFIGQARLDLSAICYKLHSSRFASKIDSVLDASVPLLRIIDKVTGIQIDLTAADQHGVKATKAVEKWLKQDTGIIKALVLVVKIFLSIRRCGTTYTGGINSYVLVWMVVAWVNLEWKKKKNITRDTSKDISSLDAALAALSMRSGSPSIAGLATANKPEDFGDALKGFLKFYGSDFDYNGKAISIEPTPYYKVKHYPYSRYTITQRYLLSIFDPADSSIDMGTKAYAINHVRASFQEAYQTLVTEETLRKMYARNESVLSKFLGGDFGKFVEKRSKMAKIR
ncbi:hypothetical protein CPB84DRAFT_1687057 [Gymnopilus junonius]|uniref:polynucleotide adenylyltransferase n=1 Tax=Gymnopilus junonius TaxID=109634 RepID=A0A9P5NFC3_GYMJU|nr:hypothetical protein CPB84DRAFT_1687057 [Gymnopilus junonius]